MSFPFLHLNPLKKSHWILTRWWLFVVPMIFSALETHPKSSCLWDRCSTCFTMLLRNVSSTARWCQRSRRLTTWEWTMNCHWAKASEIHWGSSPNSSQERGIWPTNTLDLSSKHGEQWREFDDGTIKVTGIHCDFAGGLEAATLWVEWFCRFCLGAIPSQSVVN